MTSLNTEMFKPEPTEKKWFTAFMGNAFGRPKQKRVFTWFVPICEMTGVTYHIQEGVRAGFKMHGERVKILPYHKMPSMYNQTEVYHG